MTLTNYWWLLIWMFAAGGIIAWALPKQPVMVMGKREYRWTMSSAVIFVLPYIIWAGYRKGFGDTETYRKTFRESASSLSQISQAVSDTAKDKGFTFLTVLIKSIVGNSDIIFFMLIAIVQMLCIVIVFRKYSTNFWLSMFLFVASTDYLSWMHNGMRQFLAVTIIFACTGLLLKKISSGYPCHFAGCNDTWLCVVYAAHHLSCTRQGMEQENLAVYRRCSLNHYRCRSVYAAFAKCADRHTVQRYDDK